MPAGYPRKFPSGRQLAEMERFYDDPAIEAYVTAQEWKVDQTHDVPDLGGYSVKPGRVYIDRSLGKAAPAIGGIAYDEWAAALAGSDYDGRQVGHEVAEKAAMDVWGYQYDQAHEDVGTPLEYAVVTELLGLDWDDYQKALLPFIKRAETGKIEHPPKDLDCRPYTQRPGVEDMAILQKLQARHVVDAFFQDGEFHPAKIGAKEAPDKDFYIPDYGRPSKFVRVRAGE